jgi:hypothetical protein
MDKTLEDAIATLPADGDRRPYGTFLIHGDEWKMAKRRAVEMAIRRAAEVCRELDERFTTQSDREFDEIVRAECAAAILKLLD